MDTLLNHSWLIWLALIFVFLLLEMLVPYFGFMFAALGAACASVASAWLAGWMAQSIVFVVGLLLGLVLLRPFVLRRLKSRTHLPSKTERLIRRSAVVCEAIDPVSGKGRVELDGHDWAAQHDTPLPVGTKVIIESADGIILKVRKG